jgi:putative oxidoreductase
MENIFKQIIRTDSNWTGLIARITMGTVMLPHGAQKLLGVFGGWGFARTMDFFTHKLQLPWFIAFMVIITEFFAAVALIIGFGGRLMYLLFSILLIGISVTAHLGNSFFMNWLGNQKGEGLEFMVLYFGLMVIAFIRGNGKYSVDLWLLESGKKR